MGSLGNGANSAMYTYTTCSFAALGPNQRNLAECQVPEGWRLATAGSRGDGGMGMKDFDGSSRHEEKLV